MKRASDIKKAGDWDVARARDAVVLDADERHCRRIAMTGEKGTRFVLDLPAAAHLHHGDGLVLDDGTIVRVEGKPEPLIEIRADSVSELARLSWHLGNRHAEVQVIGERLRIRRDHVLEDMLRNLGAMLEPIEAIFEPERGAYGHGRAHDHDHAHGHGHGDAHDPGHDHAHEHDRDVKDRNDWRSTREKTSP